VFGSLCAFAPDPTELTREQLERLRDLAAAPVRLLVLRRTAGVLAHAATRDPLTGLPNRLLLEESLERAFARRDRTGAEPGLLFVDLDGFKSINDTLGHATGDAALREVSRRLLTCVRASDLVARLGGDEFVVLVDDADVTSGGLEQLADRIRESLSGPSDLPGGVTVQLSASVGVARATDATDTPGALLDRADTAMYREKPGA
jgi:diguanylate cyclase (GGDEF)-like protein